MENPVIKSLPSRVMRSVSGETPRWHRPREFISPRAESTGWNRVFTWFHPRPPPDCSTKRRRDMEGTSSYTV